MDNIFAMLLEYTKLGRIVDRKFIEHAVNTLKQEKDLEEYVKSLQFKYFGTYEDSFMEYLAGNSNSIIVIKRGIKGFIKGFKSYDGPNAYERLLIINTFILNSILHELRHATEYKKSHEHDEDFESTYFRFHFFPFNMLRNAIAIPNISNAQIDTIRQKNTFITNLDQTYGINSLSERLADIYSYTDTLKLVCSLDEDLYETVKFYTIVLTNSYLRSYNHNGEISAPTMRYLDDCEPMDLPLYDEIRKKANELTATGSFEDRLRFGLPITSEEYHLVDNFAFVRQLLPKRYH